MRGGLTARPRPVVLVHGGAGAIAEARHAAAKAGCLAAARAAFRALVDGGDAVAAVVAAVTLLEDDEQFNAGRGAALTRAGTAELDAAVMRGADRAAGAVAAVRRTRNPVRLAAALLESDHVLLVGEGADAYAREEGLPTVDPDYFVTEARRAQLARHLASPAGHGMGTVGAVALDASGGLAAATSTGGRVGQRPGRVGDTPIVGAGTYADPAGAASATGDGEVFIRAVAAFTAVQAIAGLGAEGATRLAMGRVAALGGEGGLIAVAADGALGIAHNSAVLPHAFVRDGEESAGL
jgi:beta-aspartyl-peptidase (threonine type)